MRHKNVRRTPKDGLSRYENLHSQPPVRQRVFNNEKVLTQGWYPVCPSTALKPKQVQSFKLFRQRIAVYRGASGQVVALDAFCPHLGADLGNGRVVGDHLQCYFHQWELNPQGQLCRIACRPALEQSFAKVGNRAYPVQEAYGHIWVFSAPEALHPLPRPATLEGFAHAQLQALFVKEVSLFAHHHVMMANGIDLQHFAAVHNLDIAFDYQVQESENGVFDWKLRGKIPVDTLKGRMARYFLGEEFEYHVRFAGGSMVAITYGSDQYFKGWKLPSLQILWGCLPLETGVSKARVFFVQPRRSGLLGWLKTRLVFGLTLLLILLLRDEDIDAFPHMRFNTHRLIKEDASLARFIQLTNKLALSDWGELE